MIRIIRINTYSKYIHFFFILFYFIFNGVYQCFFRLLIMLIMLTLCTVLIRFIYFEV